MQYCCDFRAKRQRCDFIGKIARNGMYGGRIGMMRIMQEKISKDPPGIPDSLPDADTELTRLADAIKAWGKELGFQEICIADASAQMTQAESDLFEWLSKGYHGEMDYMVKHLRVRPLRGELHSFFGT